ncbi:MAG: extracellular solute-binding protein [Bacilli bacterium]|nr:extracellular solute-binding protein [Bacilli bacterium]
MKVFKKTIMLLSFGTIAFSALGCSKQGYVKRDYVPFDGDPTTLTAKVTFWHTMGQANQETLNRMIAGFNEKYPNITIEHAAQGGYPDIKSKISAAIPAGTTPTMAYCYPDHVADYMSAGAIEMMNPYVDDPVIGLSKEAWDSQGGVSDFVPSFWQEGAEYGTEFGEENGVYSVPYSKSTEVMFYNKSFFDENNFQVPTTWAEMEALMPQIKEKGYTALGYDSDANMLITMMEQEGIPYTSADKDNHFLFNNAEAKALVTKLKGWHDNGYIVTSGSSANNSYTSNMFVGTDENVKVVMTIGSTGGTGYNYTDQFEIGVAPIPGGTKNNHVISQGPSICFFARATQEEKYAAWLFYKWISNTNNSAIYSVLTGYSPVRNSSFKCPTFTDYTDDVTKTGKEKLVQRTLAFNEQLKDRFFVSPAFKGSSTARDEMDGIVANVFLGTKTVDQAFTDALTNCLFAG